MKRRSLVVITVCLGSVSCSRPDRAVSPATGPASTPTATTQPVESRKVVQFAPGLRIDYRRPQVEVDGEIILREGALELFAYAKAPTPKEHESIVLLRTPPHLIYQALGLIGLVPGHPMKYLPEQKKLRPPTGDAVEVLVRFKKDGRLTEVSACEWMIDVEKNEVMAPTHWLFTGSETDNGKFLADFDGTAITVVDFDSSLLSLPDLHSDSDAELWLKANTAAIPPMGTPVTLILRAAKAAR